MTTERILVHDIRNCLNFMKLSCSCLPLYSREEIAEAMESVSRSADQLLNHLNDLEELRGEDAPEGILKPPEDDEIRLDSPAR